MFSGKRTNKIIAKIQITLCLAVCLFANSACIRKDLYLRVDTTQISIQMFDIGLNLLWNVDWKAEWWYDWDESNPAFGKIDYTKPELIKTTIYDVDSRTNKRYSSFYMLFDSTGGRIRLNSGSVYDMLFYNFGTEYINFYQSDDYEQYNAFTRTSNQTSYIRTRAENTFSTMPESTKPYAVYNEPDEFFGTLINGIEINEDPSNYHKEYDKDGNLVYVYRIEAELKPYSFIYLIQIVIENNQESAEKKRITGVNGLTITGLTQGVDLFSRKTFNNTISITSEDIKPIQKHKIPDPNSPADSISVDIVATRMLTWGLPGINPIAEMENRRADANYKVPELDKNYIGIGFTLRNGYSWNVTDAITDLMHEKPTGGVITIYIDASTIPQELLDKQPTTTGGGFNATVEDWSNEVEAEVSI